MSATLIQTKGKNLLRSLIKDSGDLQINFQATPQILLISSARQRHLKYQPLASGGFSTLEKCAGQCLLQVFTEDILIFYLTQEDGRFNM